MATKKIKIGNILMTKKGFYFRIVGKKDDKFICEKINKENLSLISKTTIESLTTKIMN